MAPTRPAGDPGLAADCARLLMEGSLLVLPTETLYGLACDALSEKALARLVAAKGRETGKPLPLIAPDVASVRKLVDPVPRLFASLAERFWPGPLTLVLPARPGLPGDVAGGTGTVGIRVPGPSFALEVARAFGGALTATSANLAGKPPAKSVAELDPALASQVDLVVDGGPVASGVPSTVLDLAASPPRLLRPGALAVEVTAFLERNAPGFQVRQHK